MEVSKKSGRYQRIFEQLKELLEKENNPISRMATITAVLHHKMDYFFWTGFYIMRARDLIVGPYQGPVACMKLQKDKGVCWAGLNKEETIIVPNVHEFPEHIACDSRSQSEIVVPIKLKSGETIGVLDVDSSELNSFDEIDGEWLEKIVGLIY